MNNTDGPWSAAAGSGDRYARWTGRRDRRGVFGAQGEPKADDHRDGQRDRGDVEPAGAAHRATSVRSHAAILSAITDCPSSVGPLRSGRI